MKSITAVFIFKTTLGFSIVITVQLNIECLSELMEHKLVNVAA
jgi:hypothetical protein